ncbi:MAG TPA: hypothetical protein VE714_12300, partial [Gemmatimonadales bacterium]|nr:hypothetical protein [Gemmatimonadales bacterium]
MRRQQNDEDEEALHARYYRQIDISGHREAVFTTTKHTKSAKHAKKKSIWVSSCSSWRFVSSLYDYDVPLVSLDSVSIAFGHLPLID